MQALKTLLAGRWQVPVALVAAAGAAITLYTLRPETPAQTFADVKADLVMLRGQGASVEAADTAANLLDLDPPLPADQQAELHEFLAETIHTLEHGNPDPTPDHVAKILTHQQAAFELGRPRSAEALLRLADALEWDGQLDTARRTYESLLDSEPPAPQRREALRKLITLLELDPSATRARRQRLAELMNDDGLGVEHLWWALQRTVREALDDNDITRARNLINTHGARLRTSDMKGYLEYLEAWVLVNEGRTREAAPLVYWIDDWLGQEPLRSDRMDGYGHLPALNRWLLGRINLEELRPQEALTAFEEALAYKPALRLQMSATVGRGQALALLERHAEAIAVFREAVAALKRRSALLPRARLEFRGALVGLFEKQFAQQAFDAALPYLEMATEIAMAEQDRMVTLHLLERLGKAYRTAAEQIDDEGQSRQYFARAGRALEEAAEFQDRDDDHSAALFWEAAQAFDAGGHNAEVRRLLRAFVSARPGDPRLPQALLQLGQAYEAIGEFEDAIAQYRLLAERFPTLEETARGRLHAVDALLSLGGDKAVQAERELVALLEDDYIAPKAVVFHDALLLLADLYYQEGRYADAIARLESFLEYYPDDPDRGRALFLLADAYRLSAYALRSDGGQRAVTADVQAESDERFRQALAQYRRFLSAVQDEDSASEATQLYTRLAAINAADCLYELDEPNRHDEAIRAYQDVINRYEQTPTALVAQVQIANIHLRRGTFEEAARAVERARWLLRSVPARAFVDADDGSDRASWERYLETIMDSLIFRDVLASTR